MMQLLLFCLFFVAPVLAFSVYYALFVRAWQRDFDDWFKRAWDAGLFDDDEGDDDV